MVKCPKCKGCEMEKEVIFKKRLPQYGTRLVYFKIKWMYCPLCDFETPKKEIKISREQYEKELFIPMISNLKKNLNK